MIKNNNIVDSALTTKNSAKSREKLHEEFQQDWAAAIEDSTDMAVIQNLENNNPEMPAIEKTDGELPSLPASKQSALKQLKRKLNETDSSPAINEMPSLEPPTKRQRITFSKLLNRIQLLFQKKRG